MQIPHERAGTCTGLVVFDLDGTLLRGRTVCEVIADRIGHGRRMREMEALTDRAVISAAREEMASWYAAEKHEDLVKCLDEAEAAPGVAEGIAILKASGFAVAIASITWEFAVREFARRWGITDVLGTGLGGKFELAHVWPQDKAVFFTRLVERYQVDRDRTHAVGDSAGDIPMLLTAGNAWFVGPSIPPGIERMRHYPRADIGNIARLIVQGRENAA